MALIRANVEAVLIKRLANTLAFVDLDSTTVDGTNADLNDPIGYAIRVCSGTVDDITVVDDDDVGTVDSDDVDMLLDVAEYRAVETVLGNFDKYGLKVGPRSGYQSQVREGLEAKVKRMKTDLETDYGLRAARATAGVIGRDFAEHGEDEV